MSRFAAINARAESFGNMQRGQLVQVTPNVGFCLDIQTSGGSYLLGLRGEALITGGLNPFTMVVAEPNVGKTAFSMAINAKVMRAFAPFSTTQFHNVELTFDPRRIGREYRKYPELAHVDTSDPDSLYYCQTDSIVYPGAEEWFNATIEESARRAKDKRLRHATQFVDPKSGEPITMIEPRIPIVDSMSMLSTAQANQQLDKHDIGSSELNTVKLRLGNAKSQMVEQMLATMLRGGMFAIVTAHIGQDYSASMEKFPTDFRKLRGIKKGYKLKDTPEKATFCASNTWYLIATTPAYDKDRKQCDWPLSDSIIDQDNRDLSYVTIINLRGKGGPSGEPFDLVLSQSNGMLEELSDFLFCRNYGWFGMEVSGNKADYSFQLLPDVSLKRSTVRSKLESKTDRRVAKAAELTSLMAQMRYFGFNLPEELYCTPKQLYEDIVKLGYDWELLLNTRTYHTFLENEPYLPPYLHVIDIMRMRAGWYHPYWYPKTREEMGLPPIEQVK